MRSEYYDDIKVDYSVSYRITKGDDETLYVKESFIPEIVKSGLAAAVRKNSGELTQAAYEATDTIKGTWRH